MANADRRILVVDDERSITDLVTMALNLQGATVEVAHSGSDALRAVQTFRPHLVVLDVMLPDLDGGLVRQVAPASGWPSWPPSWPPTRGR